MTSSSTPLDAPNNMSKSLDLLSGTVTLTSALDDEDDVLRKISHIDQRTEFLYYLLTHGEEVAAIVSYHLGLGDSQRCKVSKVDEWIAGGFNICIPVYVENWAKRPGKRVLVRFPLPYKVGEFTHPGNADEKLRSEAASMAWIQEHHPSVPIPYLWGFGLSQGPGFTAIENFPLIKRVTWYVKRGFLSLLGRPLPSRYMSHKPRRTIETGYLVMDYIEDADGEMLSVSWEKLRHDQNRRHNLFRGLSRIILEIARSSFPRIGSLTIDDAGYLTLANRPLTLGLHKLENESVPTNIDRQFTYSTVDTYLSDLLACHDSRLQYKPNAIRDQADGRAQMASLTMMRGLITHFTSRDLRYGPFILSLTDVCQNNIFVDSDWNITRLVDLEWTCSLPVELLNPPFWLTSRGLDQLGKGEHLDTFARVHSEFMSAFEEEEGLLARKIGRSDKMYFTNIMRHGWENGTTWFLHAVNHPKGLYNLFLQHIQPRFDELNDQRMAEFERDTSQYWSENAPAFLDEKIRDKEKYDIQLGNAFAMAEEEQAGDEQSMSGN